MAALLTILIAVVQVAGSLLCPCRAAVACQQAGPEPACPHCRQAEPRPTPGTPCPPDSGPRSCCAAAPISAILPATPPLGEPVQADTDDWLTAPKHAAPPAVDASPWHAAANDLPFLTTSMRLYAHHALLC